MSKQRQKYLAKLSPSQMKKMTHVIQKLVARDFSGLDIKPLVGEKNMRRCRVGDLRIKYMYDGETVTILALRPRGDIYKK